MLKGNFSKKLEEIVKLKEKASVESSKSKENYISTTIKTSTHIISTLQKLLSEIEKDNNNIEETLNKVDKMYKLLVEENYTSLEKAKDKFDFWNDLDDKFNS